MGRIGGKTRERQSAIRTSRLQIWPFVSVSFGILLLLVPLCAWIVSRKAAQIDSRAREGHRLFQRADDEITEIRSDVYKAALLLRDLPKTADRGDTAVKVAALRASASRHLDTLSSLLDKTQHTQLNSLRHGLTDYWESAQKLGDLNSLRERVLELAEQIDALNTANLHLEDQQIQTQQAALRHFATMTTGLLLALGLVIAVASTAFLARLERNSEKQKVRAEQAENELRRLSTQLVRAQEDERGTISRELHDEVGQILTGLRMELGSLWRGEADGSFRQRLDSVKRLSEDAMRSIRNLALLLRPSMLDDLGLAPALRWQAKEFSRRSGIPVSVEIHGDLDHMLDSFRICLYRVIQEALTNCTKHAEATRVIVKVRQERDLVSASVQDNGKGFEMGGERTQGLGLVGMQERVRALQGRLAISSEPGKGTLVTLDLPLVAEDHAAV